MLTRVAIGLLAGTLLSAPVLAQTGTSPSTTSPSTTAPAQSQPMNQSSSAMQGSANIQYITQNRPDMWRASKLDGLNVYNQNNERIGEIDDVLVDKDGKVNAVVIGVGGFLGIGERRVAVPFEALQWQMEEQNTAATTTTGTGGTAPGTATSPTTTGTVGGAQPAGAARSDDDVPARAVLANATKDQLQQAPEFKYSR